MLSSNTSAVSGDTVYVEDVFSTYLYTGNSAARSITNNIDLSTKGGLVWIKDRTDGTRWHILTDSARGFSGGNGYILSTNVTNAQFLGGAAVTGFNSAGFSLGTVWEVNGSGDSFTSWTFRKQPKFFDVVTYTGNGTAGRTVAHNLGSAPGCVIVKCTTTGYNWPVYHRSITANGAVQLNNTAPSTSFYGPVYFGDDTNVVAPTSTVFTVGSDVNTNQSGQTYVAYIFAHDAGGFGLTGTDNVISCGTYTGTGSNVEVNLGYEAQWVLIKKADGYAADWVLVDSMRGTPVGTAITAFLAPNLSNSENQSVNTYLVGSSATGFTVTGVNGRVNESGAKYIYIAIRRGPMKVPTDATKVFDVQFEGNVPDSQKPGTRSSTGYVDMAFRAYRPGLSGWPQNWSRLNDTETLTSTTAAAAVTAQPPQFDYSNGWLNGTFASTVTAQIDYMFKRAPSFFDEVCYTGTGSTTTVTHNLGVAPELMIVKSRSAASGWAVYSSNVGATKYLVLQSTGAAVTDSTPWNNTNPTSSVFTVGTLAGTNASGATFVSYLFATCPGVSKVGSYTGTGTTKQVDCGFAAGARFVMIKRTDSTGNWHVWDTARGIVSGNDPYIALNSTGGENTTTDYIDPYSAGFELSSTAPAALNASGGSYIFLAVA